MQALATFVELWYTDNRRKVNVQFQTIFAISALKNFKG